MKCGEQSASTPKDSVDHVVFLGLTENVASFNSSPDIGFHVGLTRVFGAATEGDQP